MKDFERFKVDTNSPSGISTIDDKHVGTLEHDGYYRIYVKKGFKIPAHRLVWMLTYGEIPVGMQIDHINRNRSDNRIENLRLADRVLNQSNTSVQKNSKTGLKGISPTQDGYFRVGVSYNGKRLRKTVSTLEEALEVRDALNLQLRGTLEYVE